MIDYVADRPEQWLSLSLAEDDTRSVEITRQLNRCYVASWPVRRCLCGTALVPAWYGRLIPERDPSRFIAVSKRRVAEQGRSKISVRMASRYKSAADDALEIAFLLNCCVHIDATESRGPL